MSHGKAGSEWNQGRSWRDLSSGGATRW